MVIQEDRLDHALHSPEPARALRSLVLELAAGGHSKSEIYESLEKLLLRCRAGDHNHGNREEVVLDVMDALAGWCHPDAHLLPENNHP